jgi:hypothetical protein
MEWPLGNISLRKSHDMITSSHKRTSRQSQNRRRLRTAERRKVDEKFRVLSFQIEKALKLKRISSSLKRRSEHSAVFRVTAHKRPPVICKFADSFQEIPRYPAIEVVLSKVGSFSDLSSGSSRRLETFITVRRHF